MPRLSSTSEPRPCVTPSCYRRARAGLHFCDRCWTWATDGERAAYLVADRAPFWRRWDGLTHYGPDDLVVHDFSRVTRGVVNKGTASVEIWTLHPDEKRIQAVLLSDWMRAYEARSTREAVAHAIYARRLGGSLIPRHQEETHGDQA